MTDDDDFDALVARAVARTRVVREHLEIGAGIVFVDSTGRETLALITPEMVDVQDGELRATLLLRDGPLGHITRRSLDKLADELSCDLCPVTMHRASGDDIIAWTSTELFADGARRVAEVQRWNAGIR